MTDTRYGVGQGMQADVLQAQVELGNYLDRLFQWTQQQESFRADLNALRAKPPQTPVSRPQPLKPRPFTLKLDDLLAQAEARPQLQALKALIAKQEKAVDLAQQGIFPRCHGDRWATASGKPWPHRSIRNRRTCSPAASCSTSPSGRAPRSSPRSGRSRRNKARPKTPINLPGTSWRAAIKDRHAKLQRLAKQITLYDQGIIPQARQAVDASLASYQVGSLAF